MLQAKDASSVDYKSLSPKDKKIFDASRLVEMNGLFDLRAYELLSLEKRTNANERSVHSYDAVLGIHASGCRELRHQERVRAVNADESSKQDLCRTAA